MFRKRREKKSRIETVKELERKAYNLEVEQSKNQTYNLEPVRMYEEAAGILESLGDENQARGNHLHALHAADKVYRRHPTKESRRIIEELDKYVPRIVGPAWIILTIAGLGAGIFFLSSNITGNAIADMITKTISFLGAGLVIVGSVAGFFWIKSRNKKPVVKKKK